MTMTNELIFYLAAFVIGMLVYEEVWRQYLEYEKLKKRDKKNP